MIRRSMMRGDFRYERKITKDGTPVWQVYRRDARAVDWWDTLGIARTTGGSSRYGWEGVRAGTVVCPRLATREMVAYCLLRTQREEDA